MLLTTVRNLLAHKFRLFATGLAVMLGVAFMSGTLVLKDTIQKTFDDLFASVYDGTSAVVRQPASFKGQNGAGDQRGRVDASLVNVVKQVDGVAIAEGNTFGYAQIVDKHGDAVGDPNMGPPVIGGGWSSVPQLNNWKLVAGTPPRGPERRRHRQAQRRHDRLSRRRHGARARQRRRAPRDHRRHREIRQRELAGWSVLRPVHDGQRAATRR